MNVNATLTIFYKPKDRPEHFVVRTAVTGATWNDAMMGAAAVLRDYGKTRSDITIIAAEVREHQAVHMAATVQKTFQPHEWTVT